jgi:hypothetical protein
MLNGQKYTRQKVKFWQFNPNYNSFRGIQKLGAFAKWKRQNPEEAARIEARHKQSR